MAIKKRVDTSSVRPNTFIVVSPLTVGEQKGYWRQSQALKKARKSEIKSELQEISKQDSNSANELLVEMLKEELADSGAELAMEVGYSVLEGRVLEWNWLDANEDVLPLPNADDMSVFNDFSKEEMEIISTAIMGSSRVRKK